MRICRITFVVVLWLLAVGGCRVGGHADMFMDKSDTATATVELQVNETFVKILKMMATLVFAEIPDESTLVDRPLIGASTSDVPRRFGDVRAPDEVAVRVDQD